MPTSSYQIQQAIKKLLDARTPKIKQSFNSINGRQIDVTIKGKTIKISTELNTPRNNKKGSFR
jgi:hypothetical protein